MSALSTALGIIRAKIEGRRLAGILAAAPVPITPVAVYFADAPSTLYQLRRWYRSLEALDAVHRTVILTSDPATYRVVRSETSVAVSYAGGAPELSNVLARHGVRVVLYPNHNTLNFRVLRFATPVHIFIGHGESAKESSVSRQLKAYDRTFVAHAAAIEQLSGIRGFDAEAAAIVIGSPWLAFPGSPPPTWQSDARRVVLYAPTWEGDRPTMDYSSIESRGAAIVDAVLGAPDLRLIYRPHPWLGRVRPAAKTADIALRKRISDARNGHTVDTGAYGWSLAAADACITDVSSVAFDARSLGKPVLVTTPTGESVPPVPTTALAGMHRLEATDAAGILIELEATLASASIAPTSTDSVATFIAAVSDALELAGDSTL